MAYTFIPLEHFEIEVVERNAAGEARVKHTVPEAFIVNDCGLPWADLVVHRVSQNRSQWCVSERYTGLPVVGFPASSKISAVRQAVLKLRRMGQRKYEEVLNGA